MKNLVLLALLVINNCCFGQLLNSSFENWTYNQNASLTSQKWTLDDWLHCDNYGVQLPNPIESLLGTYKDSVAQSGLFALTLSRWYNYSYDMVKFKNKCSANPLSLKGYYRYTESTLSVGIKDTAQISVYLTRYNTGNQTIDTIGKGNIDLASVANYAIFECPIFYSQQNVFPDSIVIVIQPTKFISGVGGCPDTAWCSFLTVDNINLSYSTGASQGINQKSFLMYPNPSAMSITIEGEIWNKTMRITNFLGETVLMRSANSNIEIIETGHLTKGVYFLMIDGSLEKFIVE